MDTKLLFLGLFAFFCILSLSSASFKKDEQDMEEVGEKVEDIYAAILDGIYPWSFYFYNFVKLVLCKKLRQFVEFF